MQTQSQNSKLIQAVELLSNSTHTTVFTGAGVSVESGIPPYRGENGLWSKIDPTFLDMDYFYRYPNKSWGLIVKIFYNLFGKVQRITKARFCLFW